MRILLDTCMDIHRDPEIDYPEVRFSILSECRQMFATKLMPYMPTKAELQFEIERARSRTNLRKRTPVKHPL